MSEPPPNPGIYAQRTPPTSRLRRIYELDGVIHPWALWLIMLAMVALFVAMVVTVR